MVAYLYIPPCKHAHHLSKGFTAVTGEAKWATILLYTDNPLGKMNIELTIKDIVKTYFALNWVSFNFEFYLTFLTYWFELLWWVFSVEETNVWRTKFKSLYRCPKSLNYVLDNNSIVMSLLCICFILNLRWAIRGSSSETGLDFFSLRDHIDSVAVHVAYL